jgi:hypothetical protein
MATVGDLRSQLTSKGYQQYGDGVALVDNTIVFTLHRHPLFNQILVLTEPNDQPAREYQELLIETALKPR